MTSSSFDQLSAVFGAFALAGLVVAVTLLRAEHLGYVGVQLALLAGAPVAFLSGLAIFGEALGRLAGRPARKAVSSSAARA